MTQNYSLTEVGEFCIIGVGDFSVVVTGLPGACVFISPISPSKYCESSWNLLHRADSLMPHNSALYLIY